MLPIQWLYQINIKYFRKYSTTSIIKDLNENRLKIKYNLNYKKLENNVDVYIQNAKNRKVNCDPERVKELRFNFQMKYARNAELRRERNLHNSLKYDKKDNNYMELMNTHRKKSIQLKEDIKMMYKEIKEIENDLELEASRIPNLSHSSVPIGDSSCNKIISEHGIKKIFKDFKPKDHYDIGLKLNLFDFKTASKFIGSRFVYLKNEGARLEMALISYTLNKLRKRNFEIIFPPDLVDSKIIEGCGYQPRSNCLNSQIYNIEKSNLSLAATSEITLAAMKAYKIIDPMQDKIKFPIKLAGLSHCFRTEVGHGGKDTRGLYRLHQFTKVEMFGFCTNNDDNIKDSDSELFFNEMIEIQKEMYQELGFHFRIINMASEELGTPAALKYDIEVFMYGKNEYGEVSSLSNCTDFQARRLNIRYRSKKKNENNTSDDKEIKYNYTLNGTACAIPRVLISLLETHQQKDGSVRIPECLRPYMDMQEMIVPK